MDLETELSKTAEGLREAAEKEGSITYYTANFTEVEQEVVKEFNKTFPKIKVAIVRAPGGQLITRIKTEAAAGGGPDLFIAPNDELGNLVTAGLLEPITDTTDLGTISQQALDGATIGGKLYLVPESLKAVVMYYDSAKIPTPPTTTDEKIGRASCRERV